MRSTLLSLLGVLVLSACQGEPPSSTSPQNTSAAAQPKPPEPKPLLIEWKTNYIGPVFTSGELKGTAQRFRTKYCIQLENFPKGTEYEVSDQKGAIDKGGLFSIRVDIRGKLGGYAVAELEKVDPELTLKLKLPDGRQGETRLPAVSFQWEIEQILAQVKKGPVLFGEEPVDPKPKDSLYLVTPDNRSWWVGDSTKEFIDRVGKLNEIDFVAVAAGLQIDKGTKVCTGYRYKSGKPAPDITLLLRETEVIIYNRRTGEVVEKKVFPPERICPSSVLKSKADNTEMSAYPNEKIERWLRGKIER